MDTYGDMVTLLLCFFVLLYSMSNIDEKKWQMIVMSFNPNVTSVPSQSIPQGPDGSNSSGGGPGDAPTEDQMEEILKEMYLALDEYIKESNMESSVAVTNGDGYVFLLSATRCSSVRIAPFCWMRVRMCCEKWPPCS